MNARRGSTSQGVRTSAIRGSPNKGLDTLDFGLKPVKPATAASGTRPSMPDYPPRVEDEFFFKTTSIPAPPKGLPSGATVPQTPPGRFMR